MNISRFSIGWNTSVFIGEYGSNFSYILNRYLSDDKWISYTNYYELNINILLIDLVSNTDLKPENILISLANMDFE
jgi:hypothetical protein